MIADRSVVVSGDVHGGAPTVEGDIFLDFKQKAPNQIHVALHRTNIPAFGSLGYGRQRV